MPTIVQGSYNMVSNLQVRLQSGTDRLLYATWEWKKGNTDKYKVTWRYYTGDGVWFIGSESEESYGSAGWSVRVTYTAPNNALKVSCSVKPISKTYQKKTGKNSFTEVSYWTAQERAQSYEFSNAGLPSTPSTPSITIENDYTLVVELSVPDNNTDSIELEIVQDNKTTYAAPVVNVAKNYVRYTRKIAGGHQYKVRARARVNGIPYFSQSAKKTVNSRIDYKTVYPFYASSWSDYSSNVSTVPAAPTKITGHNIDGPNSIYLYWTAINGAKGYTVEYTVAKKFFDRSSETQTLSVTNPQAYVTQLESGQTWYFRVKATNDQGDSGWSAVYAVILGVAPSAPTTWSEVATAVAGDTIRLYWVHNSEDGSTQQAADVQVALGDGEWQNMTPTYMSQNAGEASYLEYETFLFTSDTLTDDSNANVVDSNSESIATAIYSAYAEGTTIRWRVRTKGIVAEKSPWSTERVVVVYGPPSVGLVVTDSEESESSVFTFASFPIYVKATAYPATQRAVSWHISVTANGSYEALDTVGRRVIVTAGDEVYSEYVNSTDAENELSKVLNAGNIDLENGQGYTITVKVGMSSGMTAESSQAITVNWTVDNFWPNAEIGIDQEALCAYIRPYCVDEEENLIENIVLSVYRRDYDGRFTEIATGIENLGSTIVVDPHPALDYARYRIVGISTETGMIGYYDMPGEPVGETGIVIQWNEAWSDFDMPSRDGDAVATRVWAGSMLKLPYNIRVSESTAIDKNLVEYIGRSAPVSYYGTQLGVSGSWSSDIPASDLDTRYALRRLQIWRGDAYVREPNGVGYWASVNVSFNKDYNNLLMPVTIEVTRVEGGM